MMFSGQHSEERATEALIDQDDDEEHDSGNDEHRPSDAKARSRCPGERHRTTLGQYGRQRHKRRAHADGARGQHNHADFGKDLQRPRICGVHACE